MKGFRFPLFFFLIMSVILVSVGACQTFLGNRQVSGTRTFPLRLDFLNQPDQLTPKADTSFYSPEKPKLCAALRGNGDKVLAHLSAMAGMVERIGVIEGIAGSSSSTVSMFLYESALMNPVIWDCGGVPCEDAVVRSRLAFSLKMGDVVVKGFLNNPLVKSLLDKDGAEPSPEMKQGEDFLKYGFHPKTRGLFKRLKKRIIHRFAWKIVSKKFHQFTAMAGADFLNKEVLGELEDYLINLPAQKRWEVMRAIQSLDFNNTDVSVLFREGLLNFPHLFKRVGLVADFLAGRGNYPKAQMTRVLSGQCVAQSIGKSWSEFVSAPIGKNCEKMVGNLMQNYFNRYRNAAPIANTRLKDPVGGALKTLVPVSVIINGGVEKVQRAFREYQLLYETNLPDPAPGKFESAFQAWTDRTAKIKFDLDFENEVVYGYWGRYSDLKKIATQWPVTDEVKSQKFTPLGTISWLDVLLGSPVEPGLSKLTPLKDTADHRAAGVSGYMAGGWVELHPTQVSRAIGCEKIVYVTREWPEDNEYAEGLVKLFKISEEKRKAMYDINNPSSSFNQSLREADGIWCTDWGKYQLFDLAAMTQQAFHSPVYIKNGEDSVLNRAAPLLQSYKPGCMPIERRS